MSDAIISLSDFKAEASQWLKQLQEHTDTVVLTQNGRASAVVQSFESFQRMQQSLAMLKLLAQGEADVQAGKLSDQDAVFDALQRKLETPHG